jgi:tetratricopeptide (TPR) repeat protein
MPHLRQLEAMPGFRSLALHLRLLAAVAERSTVKVRNLVKAHGRELASEGSAGEELRSLLDIHIKLLLSEQKTSEVVALAERFSESYMKTPALTPVLNEARFRLSLEEAERGNLESALDLLEQIEASTPAILHNRALILQRLGRHAEAGEYWSRLLKGEKKPKRADPEEQRRSYAATLRFVAENYRKAGNPEEAFANLKEAYALDEEDRGSLASLQQVASELGRTREACEYARRLYEAEPDNEESFYTYLHELLNRPDPEGAARLYREALERRPDNASYRSGLAFCYLQSAWETRNSDPQESERLAGEARKLDRSLPTCLP